MKGKAPEKLVWKQESVSAQDWVSSKQGCEGVYTGETMQMISGINTFGLETMSPGNGATSSSCCPQRSRMLWTFVQTATWCVQLQRLSLNLRLTS